MPNPPRTPVPEASSGRILDPQSERIGARIRSLRRSRQLTLVQLAAVTDLSHSFLSQIERGHARTSMVSLERIARALGTSQIELMAASVDVEWQPDTPSAMVVRADEGARGPYAGGTARLLVKGPRLFHPLEFEGNNTDPGDFYIHDEDEFIFVISGNIDVDLSDQGRFSLGAGDSIYYRGGTLHRWCSPSATDYRLFLVKQRAENGSP
jgi:transcriptional regulator with XRE-family HTH domain